MLALVDYPDLLDKAPDAFASDAVARAKAYLAEVRSVGAYTHSQGVAMVRREVADFIAEVRPRGCRKGRQPLTRLFPPSRSATAFRLTPKPFS